MKENPIDEKTTPESHRSIGRHGYWFPIFVGGLVGAVAGGGLVSTAKAYTAARPLGAAAQAFRGRFAEDPERAREHIEFATDWVLSRVDATDDQKAQAKQIADQTLDALLPLAIEHRTNRLALATELAKAEVDPAAIERIRQSELGLVDSFSKEITSALTEIAQTLTPEQRGELLERAQRFHP